MNSHMTKLFENNIDLDFFTIFFPKKHSKIILDIYRKKFYIAFSLWQQNLRSRSSKTKVLRNFFNIFTATKKYFLQSDKLFVSDSIFYLLFVPF